MPTFSTRDPRAVRAIAESFRERRQPPPTMLRALTNRVLIRRDAPIVQTPGGIYIPGIARIIPWTGKVLSVGPDVTQTIKVGDYVLVPQFKGEIVYHDEMLVFVPGDEIWAVVDEDFKVDAFIPDVLADGGYTPGMPGQINPGDFGL